MNGELTERERQTSTHCTPRRTTSGTIERGDYRDPEGFLFTDVEFS